MIDTIKLWIDSGGDIIRSPFDVVDYLVNVTESNNEKRGYSCRGECGNMIVYCNEAGVSIQGSLPKFFLGSNVCTLTRATAKEAIEKISDLLHIDISKARVTRVDVSTVLPTQRPPKDYYSSLGVKPHFVRLLATPITLYYNTQKRVLSFYDKAMEADFKGMEVPPSLCGCNLLRYELRLLHKLKQQLQLNENLVCGGLLAEAVYYKLIQLWRNEFFTIQKNNMVTMVQAGNIQTPKDAKDALFSILLQQGGVDYITEYLSALKAAKTFSDPKAYSRLKKELNRILQAPKQCKSDLVKELEQAVSNVAKYAR